MCLGSTSKLPCNLLFLHLQIPRQVALAIHLTWKLGTCIFLECSFVVSLSNPMYQQEFLVLFVKYIWTQSIFHLTTIAGIQALAWTTVAVSHPVVSEWPIVTFTNGYQIMSPNLKPFSGFPERAYQPYFINTAHKAYFTPQWYYLMPVHFIHSHIHLTDLASYMFPIMKTMKWYELKKKKNCLKIFFKMLLRYKHGHTYCDEHLISYIFAC